jgi:hypothetical protein
MTKLTGESFTHVKEQIQQRLLTFLYQPAEKQLKKKFFNLFYKSLELDHIPHNGEVHMYCYTTTLDRKFLNPGPTRYIDMHESLEPEMLELGRQRLTLENERGQVAAALRRMLNIAETAADVIEMLPDNIKSKARSIFPANVANHMGKVTLDSKTIAAYKQEEAAVLEHMSKRQLINLITRG